MTLKRYRGKECQSFAPDHLWCLSRDVEELELQLEAALIVIRQNWPNNPGTGSNESPIITVSSNSPEEAKK